MGQAFYLTNLDKKEYIHPHDADDGYKLLELNNSLAVMSVLLANSNDHPWSSAPMLGHWAGDRVVAMGEYAAPRDFFDTFTRLDIEPLLAYLDEV